MSALPPRLSISPVDSYCVCRGVSDSRATHTPACQVLSLTLRELRDRKQCQKQCLLYEKAQACPPKKSNRLIKEKCLTCGVLTGIFCAQKKCVMNHEAPFEKQIAIKSKTKFDFVLCSWPVLCDIIKNFTSQINSREVSNCLFVSCSICFIKYISSG